MSREEPKAGHSMPFYNKSANRKTKLIQHQIAVTYNSQKCKQIRITAWQQEVSTAPCRRPWPCTWDQKTTGSWIPQWRWKPSQRCQLVWPGRNVCPISSSAVSVTLQRWGQAATGSRRVPSEHLAAAHCHQRLRASAKLKMTPCKALGWGGEGWDASFPNLRRHPPQVLDHKVLAWPSS